jgi:hypothetical protein
MYEYWVTAIGFHEQDNERLLRSRFTTSKRRMNMLSVEIKENENIVGTVVAAEKLFKTGSKGFFGMGKIQIGEKRYQVQVQLVEIGSKPKPEEQALKP